MLRPEGADIAALERSVCAGLVEAGRLLWAAVLARLGAAPGTPVGCRECDGETVPLADALPQVRHRSPPDDTGGGY